MTEEERRLAQTKAIFIFCFSADFFQSKSWEAKNKSKRQIFQLAFKTLKNKLLKKWTKSWKAHLELILKLLMCRNTKYILQKPTPKIKQPAIQLVISQLFQKLKIRSTNKQALKHEQVLSKNKYAQ
jgi:hypothetical protein